MRFWLRVVKLWWRRQRESAEAQEPVLAAAATEAAMDFTDRYKMHIVTTPWEELGESTAPKPVVVKIATTAFAEGLARINTWPDPAVAQAVLPFAEPEPVLTPEEVAEASQVEMAALYRASTDQAYRTSLWAMMDDRRRALLWSEYAAKQADVIAQYAALEEQYVAEARRRAEAEAARAAANAVPQPLHGMRLIDLEET
jgi:hypothetical protein